MKMVMSPPLKFLERIFLWMPPRIVVASIKSSEEKLLEPYSIAPAGPVEVVDWVSAGSPGKDSESGYPLRCLLLCHLSQSFCLDFQSLCSHFRRHSCSIQCGFLGRSSMIRPAKMITAGQINR